MEQVTARIQKVMIPTYETGKPEKNPVFLEKRVYQGSSGKVYPYPVVETISDKKTDKEYEAVILENEYLLVMILPELGGRIQKAYDKTNDYDFVYYNHVIKPALVGLTGPWISGGIEFNWPQHHRPTTFLPVEYKITETKNGGKSVLLHDVDQINGTKVITKVTLYPEKAYIEIEGQLYNGTAFPQTFLWWTNPAVPVNDNTQSIFPPDVHAVMDHGKRDVSRFPIATGIYYKHDYSEGVDISRYKNIPVPTSYMAEKSNYDFIGGYDFAKEAGILHVADHHISPGKKQWTWGCGDFGKAWDRNLTEEDGPYIELMTGVYTDNQPDFSWLKPMEEKRLKQYFMPYKKVGQVKNATIDAAVNLIVENEDGKVIVYATGKFEHAQVQVCCGNRIVLDEQIFLSPITPYERSFYTEGHPEEDFSVYVWDSSKCLVSYIPEKPTPATLPLAAKAARDPNEIQTMEELYLTGLHLEQYRHATYLPDPYYLEGLKRDPEDIRINNAYGVLLLRRGQPKEAKAHFETAIKRMTTYNPNPYDSEAYYNLGLALLYQGESESAFDSFYKAIWSKEQQEMSYYYMAVIQAQLGNYLTALEFVENALIRNIHNIKALGLKAYLLRKLGRIPEAQTQLQENLQLDPFDFLTILEGIFCSDTKISVPAATVQTALRCARDYAQFGAYSEAYQTLQQCTESSPLIKYYAAYYQSRLGNPEQAQEFLIQAEACLADYCFPNCLEDIPVLEFAIAHGAVCRAPYYLGNLYYDKLQYDKAIRLWELAAIQDNSFPTVHRNLALAYYNKLQDPKRALHELEKAFSLDETDARIFLELDQLYRKTGKSEKERLAWYECHKELIGKRDALYTEYITLLNMDGQYENAYECIMGHNFHPWEGGEGKLPAQYKFSLLQMGKKALQIPDLQRAETLLKKALNYPINLGEGKLEGTKDNDIHYFLGLIYEQQGRNEEARSEFQLAEQGTDEPAGVLYYNDQPADMILYQGLAYLKEQHPGKAKARFYRLIDYGERHLKDKVKPDYFAVSLPDLSVFEEDEGRRNRSHCYYLMGLGNLGLSALEQAAYFRKQAVSFLQQALQTEPSYRMPRLYLEELKLWKKGKEKHV